MTTYNKQELFHADMMGQHFGSWANKTRQKYHEAAEIDDEINFSINHRNYTKTTAFEEVISNKKFHDHENQTWANGLFLYLFVERTK